jgi:hypothetical protein
MLLFSILIIILIALIAVKIMTKKELPSSNYTPFDYITGQTNIEFHEEKEETEEENDKGDDKDKNNTN